MESGTTFADSPALCFTAISWKEYEELKTFTGVDGYFVPFTDDQVANTKCTVYFGTTKGMEMFAILAIGEKGNHEAESLISTHQSKKVGVFEITPEFPVIRICDSREAHYISQAPTTELMNYAAKKAGCSQQQIDEGEFRPWDLSEPLHSMPPSYSLQFWTSLDPTLFLRVCEEKTEELKGFYQLPSGHWALPAVEDVEVVTIQTEVFEEVKEALRFRCGYRIYCRHLIYDICLERIEKAEDGGVEYPTNTGTGVAVNASSNTYAVDVINPYAAYVIRTLSDEEIEEMVRS
jgi:hypothetical protein